MRWILGAALIASACTPPHYSVAVARGPGHVTFGQRHHDPEKNDYLVDCRVAADGAVADCQPIPLESK